MRESLCRIKKNIVHVTLRQHSDGRVSAFAALRPFVHSGRQFKILIGDHESKNEIVLAGVRAESPLLVGVFPFGLIYGALALSSGLAPFPAQMMSSIVFAGSSQFVAAQLIHDSAPGLVIVLTIAVVNMRHMLYSASVAPYIEHLPTRWKALLAYLLTDEAYAATIIHYEEEGFTPTSHWFFLGAARRYGPPGRSAVRWGSSWARRFPRRGRSILPCH